MPRQARLKTQHATRKDDMDLKLQYSRESEEEQFMGIVLNQSGASTFWMNGGGPEKDRYFCEAE